jgi:hypothetical protein
MSKQPFTIFVIVAAICLVAIPFYALAKEGGEDAGLVDVAAKDRPAKDIFNNNCGYCHTLAAGGTDGIVGPNLDELLVPTGANTAEQYDGIYARVLRAVSCGQAGRMPKGIVVGDEDREVAAFVAAYAGQIEKGPTVDISTAKKPEPASCGGTTTTG